MRMPEPSARQRWSTATGVVWQLTQRLQRVETKRMSPSGSQIGSMSL